MAGDRQIRHAVESEERQSLGIFPEAIGTLMVECTHSKRVAAWLAILQRTAGDLAGSDRRRSDRSPTVIAVRLPGTDECESPSETYTHGRNVAMAIAPRLTDRIHSDVSDLYVRCRAILAALTIGPNPRIRPRRESIGRKNYLKDCPTLGTVLEVWSWNGP